MKQILFLLSLLIFISCGPAESKKIPSQQSKNDTSFDSYFVESSDTVSTHGPRNITRNILQDKKGKFWFASWEGIICYDTLTKLFTNITLKEGLKHYRAFSLLEDKAGNIWVGTTGNGVYCFNLSAESGSDKKSFVNFTTEDGLVNNTVLCILQDKAGNIWFGTEGGVCRYNSSAEFNTNAKSIFTSFTLKENLLSKDIFSISEDKTGTLWFTTRSDGVFCYDPSKELTTGEKIFTAFKNKDGVPFTDARSILEDKTGKIWIGNRNGLCCYNPLANLNEGPSTELRTSPSTELRTSEKLFINFIKGFVTTIYEDKTGKLWFCTSEININGIYYSGSDEANNRERDDGMALYCYDGKVFTKITERSDLNDRQIFGVCEDETGNIWFGTMQGVSRYNRSRENHPCNKNTCKHDLKVQQDIKEHNEELSKSFTNFKE
ncbi:MAG: hypothetical protein IAF38_22895 [Bacteroidia bacterium]|nr:hypothetical protein [Bacteroidia bacterium]